ncbi:MAG: transposase, partial [Nitrososphaerota archaeon]|nr:transposase [Nitrososphaerota archaeon]
MSTTGRDWHSYNEALVRRGELNLDSSVVEEWRRELKKANEGKVGEPYRYPESYIRFLAFVRLLFHQPYRQTEGFVHSLSRFVEGLQAPDYSTIDRRVNRLRVDLDESLV